MSDGADYPELAALLGGYFHQDYDLEHGTFEGVLNDYVATGDREDVRATIVDIDSFVADHHGDLVGAADRCFRPDIIIGTTEAEAEAWFAWLRDGLVRRLA